MTDGPPRARPWSGPPIATFPGTLDLDEIVAHTEDAFVALTRIDAYVDGCRLAYAAAVRPARDQRAVLRQMFADNDKGLRFELRLPDGTRTSAAEGDLRLRGSSGEPVPRPEPPVLSVATGAGGQAGDDGLEVQQPLWLWPLPPPEKFTVSVTWERFGITDATHVLDGKKIHEAAERARPFW